MFLDISYVDAAKFGTRSTKDAAREVADHRFIAFMYGSTPSYLSQLTPVNPQTRARYRYRYHPCSYPCAMPVPEALGASAAMWASDAIPDVASTLPALDKKSAAMKSFGANL